MKRTQAGMAGWTLRGTRAALLMMCVGVAGVTPMLAQDAPPASQSEPQGPPPGGRRGGGGEMQGRQVEMLTRRLNLSDDQVAKLKAIEAETQQQMMALRNDSSTAGYEKRQKMLMIRESSEDKLQAVLTREQKTKYTEMRAEMRAKMRERREEHQEGGPARQGDGVPAAQPAPSPAPTV